jgi:ribosomal protein L37AE/L43A
MIRRQCPNCKTNWYSANTDPLWVCDNCGGYITEKDERPLEGRENDADTGQFCGQEP